MSSLITTLENKRLLWRAGRPPLCPSNYAETGFREVDEALAGGWPQQGVVALQSVSGLGELRLFLPNLLARCQRDNKLLVFISPPYTVNAEMLCEQGFALNQVVFVYPPDNASRLWSAEQCLKSGCCAAVLMWPDRLQVHQVKRLQLAAQQGNALNLVLGDKPIYRGLPFSLALTLTPASQGIVINVNKRRGGGPVAPFSVNMAQHWPKLVHVPRPDNLYHLPKRQVGL